MDDIQRLLVKTNGSAYMFVVLNWRTNESYFVVEKYPAGGATRCQTLLEAEKRFEAICGDGKEGA